MLLKLKHTFLPRFSRTLLLVLLTGVIPLFALWNQNIDQIQAKIIIQPLIYTILFNLIILGIWLLISRSIDKAVLLTCLTIIMFFSFGHTYNLIEGKRLIGFSVGYMKLLAMFLIIYIFLIVLIFKNDKVIKIPYASLLFIVILLLSMNLIPALIFQINLNKPNSNAQVVENATQNSGRSNRDIYFIILDAYAREDILSEVLDYDNTPFINGLLERGFYIPDCAFSNYDGTNLAVASILNYDYLPNSNASNIAIEEDTSTNSNWILDNKVWNYFKQIGYSFVTGRGYSAFNDIVDSDIYLNYLKDQQGIDDLAQNKFNALYLNTTMIRVLTEVYRSNPYKYSRIPYWFAFNREVDPYLKEASFWYYQNHYIFDSLEKFPKEPGDFLVYAHINSPHGPYVFRSDGSFRYPLDTNDEKVLYSDTITYLNKRVLEVIDVLIKDSELQPIIIIQGDHSIHGMTTGLGLHKILSAYYLPGELNTPPYSTITPVNDFRLIIKNYFDPTISLLPDTLYVKFLNAHETVPASCELDQ